MNKIIFTTAYKDINRIKWDNFKRSNDHYLRGFKNLCSNIPYTLIVYVEEDIKKLITETIQIASNIIFMDITKVDTFYNKYLDIDKEIIQSEAYLKKIPLNRKDCPEHKYSEYNLINHSKINFVNYTKKKFPKYKYYAWIDFGTMNENIDNIPKNIDFTLIPPKITFKCIVNPPQKRPSENEMLASNCIYFLGSSFIIFTDLVEHYEKIYESKLIEWQKKGITDDDQSLILQLYYDNPKLFHIINHSKWFGFYSALKRNNLQNNPNYPLNVVK